MFADFTKAVDSWPTTDSTEELELAISKDPAWSCIEDTMPPTPWKRSLDQSWTLKLYNISLRLKRLRLYKEVQAGIEVFGPNFGNGPAAEWPLLEEFSLDYDQCIIDTLEPPTRNELENTSRVHLEQAQDLVWQASAAAAQRMPQLKIMTLTGYLIDRDFEFSALGKDRIPDCRGEPYVEVVWSGHGYAGWKPSNKVLRTWHTIAARKRCSGLRVVMTEGPTDMFHRGYFPTCVDGMPVPFSNSRAIWDVEDWSDDWDADPH